ncbi:TadE-like protein [Thermanaeromonas toyohensis ToBE]|uniref:TadE-like protein n=1 Tax=Thermanaeromonas toyohensis ToBE TaxID=698762 RepID=A0A1W1VQV3_9FIRM|nr:TadE-like protein [Thermanaeromonas toyohensis ToBE]
MVLRFLKDERGNSLIEALLVLPLFLILFFLLIEMGFVVYDWAVVNYATASAAAKASSEGRFSETIRQETAAYLKQWTVNGKDLGVDFLAGAPYYSSDTMVIWGTPAGMNVQRGQEIVVGVVYPVRFKTFLVGALGQWLIQEEQLTLKTRAVTTSEAFFE